MKLMKKRVIGNKVTFLLFLIVTVISFAQAATIITTDLFGNPKTDYSPNEFVYISGSEFLPNSLIITKITRPDLTIDTIFSVSDSNRKFFAIYNLNGIKGNYNVISTDGRNTATILFTDAAIWTTKNNCDSQNQDVNKYSINEIVYINGDGFSSGTYNWTIVGKPGGASCDPNEIVASGTRIINSSESFCIAAYNISSDDCGEYQVKFDVKGDNYRVIPSGCSSDSDCGIESSELMCSGINVINMTITPDCIFERERCISEKCLPPIGRCIFTSSNTTIKTCNLSSSVYSCSNNDIIRVTTTQGCSNGECYNITGSPDLTIDCGNSFSQLVCIGLDVYNQSTEMGCDNAQCFSNNNSLFLKNCGSPNSEITCQGNKVINITTIPSCISGSCFSENITQIIEYCLNDCEDGECTPDECDDEDNDGVCDNEDECPDTEPNEPVDENGCSNPQFCSLQDDCGMGCESADWKNNEEKIENPHDCITVIIANEGTLEPMCAGTTCAN